MKILILGSDGYLGRALTSYLKEQGHDVVGVDNNLRQKNVRSLGGETLIPIKSTSIHLGDIRIYSFLEYIIYTEKPQVIVHLAEQPSAPFSMMSAEEAFKTQENNVLGTLNLLWVIKELNRDIHLVKLGTMGVYGTPDKDIPETNESVAYNPPSFYHNSKAFDSINIRKACEWWGLNASDLHQGVVYGYVDGTRFDYDHCFGTVINRFLVQALIGYPLTVYGTGNQKRGFINIQDTLRCIELAIENPAKGYRVFNQLAEVFSINYLAKEVQKFTGAKIEYLDNPRIEAEEHRYTPTYKRLKDLGWKPRCLKDELKNSWEKIQPYKSRVIKEVIMPKVKW